MPCVARPVYSASMADNLQVLSLGGSIVAPDGVDTGYLKRLRVTLSSFLVSDEARRLVLVVGGGAPARAYQQAYRSIVESPGDNEQDWIGVAATRLNGELIRALFAEYCDAPVLTDPSGDANLDGKVIVAAGWKPGFSTDYVSVALSERLGARRLINLSNIAKVYSSDPRTHGDARPLDKLTWKEFREIVGDEWIPGKNAPFDPVASRRASESHLEVIVAAGRDIENLAAILEGRAFIGTRIGPE